MCVCVCVCVCVCARRLSAYRHLAVVLVLQSKVVSLHQVQVGGDQVKQQLARRPLLEEHKQDGGG